MKANSSLTPDQHCEVIAWFEQGRADHAVVPRNGRSGACTDGGGSMARERVMTGRSIQAESVTSTRAASPCPFGVPRQTTATV